jgi:hypothetical protein
MANISHFVYPNHIPADKFKKRETSPPNPKLEAMKERLRTKQSNKTKSKQIK